MSIIAVLIFITAIIAVYIFWRRKKKTTIDQPQMLISIKKDGDVVNFTVEWDNNNSEEIQFFTKIMFMLNNGQLKDHMKKAVIHRGVINNDEATANAIVRHLDNLDKTTGKKLADMNYIQSKVSSFKRNPIISPDKVLTVFKNFINS